MKRQEAIQQGMLVLSYLSFYFEEAYVTMDIGQAGVYLNYYDYDDIYGPSEKIIEKIDLLRVAGSELEIKEPTSGGLIITITWKYRE